MAAQPTLETGRLLLRPFATGDAPDVQRLAGDREIARTTANIPHPYEPGMAEAWISRHEGDWTNGVAMVCAMVRKEDRQLVGAIGLTIDRDHLKAELGYWVGRPWWGLGFATEAGRTLVGYGFTGLGLNRIMARHFASNPASGRVMEKIGMSREGVMRQHYLKWGTFEDVVFYGMLASAYDR